MPNEHSLTASKPSHGFDANSNARFVTQRPLSLTTFFFPFSFTVGSFPCPGECPLGAFIICVEASSHGFLCNCECQIHHRSPLTDFLALSPQCVSACSFATSCTAWHSTFCVREPLLHGLGPISECDSFLHSFFNVRRPFVNGRG